MALPTGQISLSQVNTELGRSSTAAISMNDSGLRSLFGKSSGAISMNDGRGKSSAFAFTIASNVNNADLRTLALNAGWNGSSAVTATINSGVVIGSGSTASPALTISGSFPGGVQLINNGTIAGRGGNGGYGGTIGLHTQSSKTGSCGAMTYTDTRTNGSSGGTALSASSAVTITNNGTIGGGGGGGGIAGDRYLYLPPYQCGIPVPNNQWARGGPGGGGAGGGSGASFIKFRQADTEAYISTYCGAGNGSKGASYSSASGGITTGGAGGNPVASVGGPCTNLPTSAQIGGSGGSLGSAGNAGAAVVADGMVINSNGGMQNTAGGAGGAAVSGNSNITWAATGTRLGAIA